MTVIPVSASGAGGEVLNAAVSVQSSVPTVPQQRFDFSLPALPLIEALQRYGQIARKPALYRSEILNGQISSPVWGHYSPEEALHLMLIGTGVVAEKFDDGSGSAFVLKEIKGVTALRVAGLGNLAGYPSLIQSSVWLALCANPATRPGGYRLLLRFYVGAKGQIMQVRLIGSTGEPGRDAAVREALQHIRMDSAPPPGMPQPVTLFLLPDRESVGVRCDNDNTRRGTGS